MSVPDLLLASLNPATRLVAEKQLDESSKQPGFLSHLLTLPLNKSNPPEVRTAASIYFKNTVKRRWSPDEEDFPISEGDKNAVRAELVPAMLALSKSGADKTDRLARPQLAESLAIIAGEDYPDRWPTLIDQLTSSLSETDYTVNVGVLEAAHAVCAPWKSQVRSDKLFSTINAVVGVLGNPILGMFRYVTGILLGGGAAGLGEEQQKVLAQTLHLLLCLYADLVDQDIPPVFEDSVPEFFGVAGGDDGLFLKILVWNPEALKGDPEEPTPTPVHNAHQVIFEIAEMFVLKYNELFESRMPAFVQAVWEMVGRMGVEVREDGVFAQSVRFLSVTVKSGLHTQLFSQQSTLQGLFTRIVLPSVPLRQHEIEQFEDDPLEYIRRDLGSGSAASAGSGAIEVTGRRGAATDLLRALMGVGLEAQVTEMVNEAVEALVGKYKAGEGGEDAWMHKDTAVYLLSAVAARGSTVQHGVTSTNIHVNVVQFFLDHVAGDLQASAGTIHPILQVDAIRFVHMFRNQFTKEQLLPVLRLLVTHLSSKDYVCSSYAAIAIERILFIKTGGKLVFAQADIHDFANDILSALLVKIESGETPQKIAENDYLMKCVMRVIITARQTLTPNFLTVLTKLVNILGAISQNPSNPNFNQYTFESVSALMRFVCASNPQLVEQFEGQLFGPFTIIIQQDVDQFIPYVFQILAQMLEIHTNTVPPAYSSLVGILFTPAVWQQRGNVPALVRLIKAFITKDPNSVDVRTVLAVVQQRLIPSRVNDVYGFELLEVLVANLPVGTLGPLFNGILVTIMTRLQANKTPAFSYGFMHFACATMAVRTEGMGPDFFIGAVESVQPGLWTQLLTHVLLPDVSRTQVRDQKVVSVGLTRLLVHSQQSVQAPAASAWPRVLEAILGLYTSPAALAKSSTESATGDDAVTAIDYEEAGAGYQAGYSRLAASEGDKTDLAGYVQDPRQYLVEQLNAAVQDTSKPIRQLIAQVEPEKLNQLTVAGLRI
ncbi:putative importin-alpha export receptor [Rhizoctonia solani 123E]|uniref:Putative importin-alpha export receptor n=1 Tax=Rhizoctonia solani 123E TaxID=1423351 RepID=A0A074RTF9_9AGAM|nr:putative importin-alpha export receptor [Rhizoctonia solani 123E]